MVGHRLKVALPIGYNGAGLIIFALRWDKSSPQNVPFHTLLILLILVLKYKTMDKVHDGNNLECDVPAPGCLNIT